MTVTFSSRVELRTCREATHGPPRKKATCLERSKWLFKMEAAGQFHFTLLGVAGLALILLPNQDFDEPNQHSHETDASSLSDPLMANYPIRIHSSSALEYTKNLGWVPRFPSSCRMALCV